MLVRLGSQYIIGDNLSFTNSKSNKFYHVSRHPELIITKDRDAMAFIPDHLQLDINPGTMSLREQAGGSVVATGQAQTTALEKSVRLLMWARASHTNLVSAFRWVPYTEDVNNLDGGTISPLREVYAPRVEYDRTSNSLHLWFWTNVDIDYMGPEYQESSLYHIGVDDFYSHVNVGDYEENAKRVLCYATGILAHYHVDGGWIGGASSADSWEKFDGINDSISGGVDFQSYGSGETSFSTSQYDLVPIFNKPTIITYLPDPAEEFSGQGPGIIADGWYDSSSPSSLNFTFKVETTLVGSDWISTMSGGYVHVLNQITGVSDVLISDNLGLGTGGAAYSIYLDVPLSGTWNNTVGAITVIATTSGIPTNSATNLYYVIASVNASGDVSQNVLGDIYDMNVPFGGSQYDVVMLDTSGKPTVSSLRAQ